MRGLKEGTTISTPVHASNGRGRKDKALIHGISPLENRAGAAVWQTSRVPISAWLSCPKVNEKEGGTEMLTAIANNMMAACHFIKLLYDRSSIDVNEKL
jgi:hypothetical protein